MKIDLKNYKKTKEDKAYVVLQNHKGHQMTIAKNSLSEKMRGEFAAMPVHMADGGLLDDPNRPIGQESFPPGYIPPAPAQAVPAPQADPDLLAKRQMYNKILMGIPGDPLAQVPHVPGLTFGPNGEEPDKFHPDMWQKAEEAIDGEKERQKNIANTVAKEKYESVQSENKARLSAGLKPIAEPEAPMLAQEEPLTPPPANIPDAQGHDIGQMASFGQEQTNQGDNAYLTGLQEQKAGLGMEAQAMGAQGRAEALAAQEQQTHALEMQKNYESTYSNLEQERQNILKDIQDNHINPNHYMENMSAIGKVSTAIGMVLSGLGSGGSGQPNMAAQFINNQIDRDIAAQKSNLGKQENLLSANMRQFGNAKDALEMTRVMQNDIYSTKLKEAAAKSMDPVAKARALQMAGQLDIQSAPLLQQMAARKSIQQSGAAQPEMVIHTLAPESEKAGLFKELQTAQNMSKQKDNLLSAFDKIEKVDTVGQRIKSPIQTPKQIHAILEPMLADLVKDSEGRINETTVEMIRHLMPAAGDDPQTTHQKRSQLNTFLSQKMSFPSLKPYGIDPNNFGRFNPHGQSRFAIQPPVKPKGG